MTTKADSKKRVILPEANPGDVFDIHDEGEGRFLLIKLTPPKPKIRSSRAQCLRAIADAPLSPKMDWESLKTITREP
jgi:hypothetical protein